MIKKQSDDPDVKHAAHQAAKIVKEILSNLPQPKKFDYGGHIIEVGEYEICDDCSKAIAESQQAYEALAKAAEDEQDSTIKEHLNVAAQLFKHESEVAVIRAELHNGFGTEQMLNTMLGFIYDRNIHDDYKHAHGKGE